MSRRPGFALPMVLSLVVIVGMMSAVMVERQMTQRLVVQRQLDWYQEHHARLGLQEAIDAWIKSLPSGFDLAASLPEDGHFLDLELRGGMNAIVSFREHQNAVLTDLAAVDEVSLESAAAIVTAVMVAFGPAGPPDGLRTVGPATLSVHTMSPELLEVAAQGVLGDAGPARLFAESLLSDRQANGGRCSASAIGIAVGEAGIDPEIRTLVTRMFTVRPTLFYATVELRRSSYGDPLARYGGYFLVTSTRSGASSTERSAFLTWENLRIE